MFKKDSFSGLKAFGLLALFMLISVTFGAIFFSKIIMIVMTYSLIRTLFGLLIFGTLFAICGYVLYKIAKKGVAISLFIWNTIRVSLLKWFPAISKLDPYTQQVATAFHSLSQHTKNQYSQTVEKIRIPMSVQLHKMKQKK